MSIFKRVLNLFTPPSLQCEITQNEVQLFSIKDEFGTALKWSIALADIVRISALQTMPFVLILYFDTKNDLTYSINEETKGFDILLNKLPEIFPEFSANDLSAAMVSDEEIFTLWENPKICKA